MTDRKTDWVPILVTSTVVLFATSILLYAVAENRKSDNEYFKGRLASLESRINQQDKRLDAIEEFNKKITADLKEITTLTIQINANVIENTKKLEEITNPPKPLPKKGKPKSAFKEQPYIPPIQGPTPVPPPPRKTPYAIEGKKE
jgi:septal ring factor EnvC (AmiA/AmiB activator)